MRLLNKTVLAAVLALLASSAAWAEVTVSYVKPEEFTDIDRSPIDRENTLKNFTDYFKSLEKKLPAGQSLKIEVLDIDLAGRLYPRRAGSEIRIMNGGADWPHMHLKYTLEQDGQVLRSGDEQLSNMDYQGRIGAYFDSDPLRYEKQMLDDWFKKTIVPQVAKR